MRVSVARGKPVPRPLWKTDMPLRFTPRSFARTLIVWFLIAFFLVGAIGNLLPPASVTADYARWGYPQDFHYLTGAIELTAALLISREAQRGIGLILGGLVMAGALATLLLHGEASHAAAPAGIIAALLLCRLFDAGAQEALWEGRAY